MKASIIEKYGGPEVLSYTEFPVPQPRRGEALVKVHAVGLNGYDLMARAGRYKPNMTPSAPGEAPLGLHTTGNAIFNRMWTLLHTPAVTLPSHTGPHGLPVGVQVIGPLGMDDRLLAIAAWMHARLV